MTGFALSLQELHLFYLLEQFLILREYVFLCIKPERKQRSTELNSKFVFNVYLKNKWKFNDAFSSDF